MTWIRCKTWKLDQCRVETVQSVWSHEDEKVTPATDSTCIVTESPEEEWEECRYGEDHNNGGFPKSNKPLLEISFSAFFSVSALLHSILSRYPNLTKPFFDARAAILPNYSYSLLGIHNGGRTAEVLVVFAVGPVGKGCLGVHVEVDVITQDYCELGWVRITSSDSPYLQPKACIDRRLRRVEARGREQFLATNAYQALFSDSEAISNTAVCHRSPILKFEARSVPVILEYR